jgi:hypothetical protein
MDAPRTKRLDWARLWFTKAALFIFLLGVCFVGHRRGAWPIVYWSMYSKQIIPFPKDKFSAFKLEAVTTEGERLSFAMSDFYPAGREIIAENLVKCAFQDADLEKQNRCGESLKALITRAASGRELVAVEGWEITWEADPLSNPPLNRSQPIERLLLGRIELSGLPAGGER